MRRRRICGFASWVILLALLLSGVNSAMAEETLLPASALLMMQTGNLKTGDYSIQLPEAKFNSMNAAEVDSLLEAMQDYVPPETSLLVNQSQYYYYYDHLDPVAREIYDLILQVARDPVSEGNAAVMMTPIAPYSAQFTNAYLRASFAITLDHPELFWLYFSCNEAEITFSGENRMVNGRYTVFFRMEEPFEEFEAQMTAFNRAADAFLADIDRTASQRDIAKQIHDKLIDMVTYDLPCCERNGDDLAHTAYGALVENSIGTPHFAVCDGYSLAYIYLLQQCGIPATFIGGAGGSAPYDMGGHAWSIVNIDGEWYEVDSTWDDNQIDEAMYEDSQNDPWYQDLMEIIHDPVMRERLGHIYFLISSDRMEHFVVPEDEDWNFWFSDGRGPFDVRPDECYHKRDGQDEGLEILGISDPIDSVISLAPRAERDYPKQ